MEDIDVAISGSQGSMAAAGGDATATSEGVSWVRPAVRHGHAPGELLAGKYRILGFLGEGGMGTVWRARSLSLDVDVAIKVLHGEHDANASERLLREARVLARLGHPGIV